MITIIHGDNHIQSRERLSQILSSAKGRDTEIVRLVGAQLSESVLEEVFGSSNLFGSSRLIVIEELHSLPKSKKKDQLIDQVARAEQEDIVLWEKKLLTKTQLKKFPDAKVDEFKTSSVLFKWLDQIGAKDKKKILQLFHQALETEEEYFCFIMLIRQIRLLIHTKEGTASGAPFMQAKLAKQAQSLSLEQLLSIHAKLLEIDYQQKRSLSPLSLTQQLDLLLLEM